MLPLQVVGCLFALPFLIYFFLKFYIGSSVRCTTKNRLDDRTVVVTGATSGIGKAVATECARRGAKVILACRDKTKSEACMTQIRKKTGNEKVHFLTLDLSSLSTVTEFVDTCAKVHGPIDVLVNNAAYLGPQAKSNDGLEMTLQVNYLGHFLLTFLQVEEQKPTEGRPLRVINIASDAYKKARMDFEDLMYTKRKYDIYGVYAASKLALMLFTMEISYKYANTGVVAMAVIPGIHEFYDGPVKSGLLRNWPGLFGSSLRCFASLLFRSPDGGAQSVVHCATVDDLVVPELSGKAVSECRVVESQPHARHYRDAERLWAISLGLVGLESRTVSRRPSLLL